MLPDAHSVANDRTYELTACKTQAIVIFTKTATKRYPLCSLQKGYYWRIVLLIT